MIDCHIHTKFSPDGCEEAEDIIKAAIERGAEYIAITDHVDLMYHNPNSIGVSDLVSYYNNLLPLKEKYANQIYIAIGIECGWMSKNESSNANLLKTAPVEYIINSVHEINGSDCYSVRHYDGRERDDAYNEYFEAVLKSLDAPYNYHTIGHLAYAARNAPYTNNKIYYTEFSNVIDEILKKIIAKDKILELNTSVRGAKSLALPDFDIVKRYRELGGKNITFSSDAHTVERLFDRYDEVSEKVKELGFRDWTVVKCGKLVGVKI